MALASTPKAISGSCWYCEMALTSLFFFLNNTPPPKIYPLPLPDAFPIPMPPLQATEGGDWAPPADRPYGEPHGLRHRWGIGRAHLRFWVAGPTQGEARADRSGEQLDPEIGRAHV